MGNDKATALLSRAEVNISGAEEVLVERRLKQLSGELQAVKTILSTIRRESFPDRRRIT